MGRTAEHTGTNRDYLAVLHGIGPDEGAVRQSLTAFRGDLQWTIVE